MRCTAIRTIARRLRLSPRQQVCGLSDCGSKARMRRLLRAFALASPMSPTRPPMSSDGSYAPTSVDSTGTESTRHVDPRVWPMRQRPWLPITLMEVLMKTNTFWETFKAEGENVVERVRELIREGNVRRVVVKHEGRK